MATEPTKSGWLARRREKQRLKRERTGDTPEKRSQGRRGAGESQVKGAADAAGRGLMAGGGPG